GGDDLQGVSHSPQLARPRYRPSAGGQHLHESLRRRSSGYDITESSSRCLAPALFGHRRHSLRDVCRPGRRTAVRLSFFLETASILRVTHPVGHTYRSPPPRHEQLSYGIRVTKFEVAALWSA